MCWERERERENSNKKNEMFWNVLYLSYINYTCLCQYVFVGMVQKSQSQMQTTAKATTATTGQSSKIQEAFGKS